MIYKNRNRIAYLLQLGCLGISVCLLFYMLGNIEAKSFKYRLVHDVLFYTPNAPRDLIQRFLHVTGNFFEERELNIVKEYIPENAVILDIGANIGNHSLYWATKCNPTKIYAFEPIPDTFDILKRNVELNFQSKRVELFNIGLSDVRSQAEIIAFYPHNIGQTSIKKSEHGNLVVDKLDNIPIKENRVDLMKIDVEGHEPLVLKGAIETIKKYKPVIYIELKSEEGDKILRNLGYDMKIQLSGEDYLYIYHGSGRQ